MTSFRSLLVAASFFLSLGLVSPAYAEPTQAEKDIARAYLKEARELHAAKEYARSAELYEKAHNIMHAPITAFELMDTYAFLEKDVEAWAIGEEMMARPPKPGEPQPFVVARENIAKAMRDLASRISVLTLQFKSPRPSGIEVTIDEKILTNEQVDKPYRVNRGEHEIVCKAPGYVEKRIKQTVTTKVAEEFPIVIDIEPLPKPEPIPNVSSVKTRPAQQAPEPSRVPWVVFGASGALALVLGAWAGVTYAPMADAWNEPVYNPSRAEQFEGSAAKLQALSISSVAVGVVSVGALGFALYETFRPRKIRPAAQVAVSSHGLSVVGVW